MLTFEILKNGNLAFKADDPSEVEDMINADQDFWYIMSELFESTMTNGSYFCFDASHGNPFVGLTSAPCIGESMDVDDEGNVTVEGRLWYFNEYCYKSEIELLAAGEVVEYTLHA